MAAPGSKGSGSNGSGPSGSGPSGSGPNGSGPSGSGSNGSSTDGSSRGGKAGHWFESVADFLGPAYLRYSFTKGTVREVAFLLDALELGPGDRVLDVGCGPGRHALALAAAGVEVVGIDISAVFVELASAAARDQGLERRARFEVADARLLSRDPAFDGRFDAVISLCQGAFGLAGGPGAHDVGERELDEPIVAGMAHALRRGGRLAVSAFSAYFQVRYLEGHDDFDAALGVNRESTVLRDESGAKRPAELWTSCFTPRELRLLARVAGLRPRVVYGVTPGAYRADPPSLSCPEFLLLADKPA